jgi:hypothetical protein
MPKTVGFSISGLLGTPADCSLQLHASLCHYSFITRFGARHLLQGWIFVFSTNNI